MPENNYSCPVEVTISVIGGKWKCVVLWWLRRDAKTFGELKQLMPGITSKVLTQQLRELEESDLLRREAYAETPRRVEYSLTSYGKTLIPIADLMCEWGKNHLSGFESGYLNLNNLRVLLVGKADSSDSLRSALEVRQARVTLLESISEVLTELKRESPDILVVDLLNGADVETIAKIRGLLVQVPAIAISHPDTLERRQALRAGFQISLTKPVEVAELVAAIASLIAVRMP